MKFKRYEVGTSLVDPAVDTSFPVQGMWIQSLVRELRSHMPHGQNTKNIKNRSNIVAKINKHLKNVYHQKIFLKQRYKI